MNKILLRSTLAVSLLAVILLISSCGKSSNTTTPDSVPSIGTTNVIINVTSTSAVSGGTVTANGGETVTANGVCWSSTNQTPTIADSKTTDSVKENFVSKITGLTANTTYYLRAYATNSVGTGYGSVIKFTTNSDQGGLTATVTTYAGSQTPGYGNGGLTSALFNSPQGILIDAAGNMYIGDTFNATIRLIAGGSVITVAGNGVLGYTDGASNIAQFYAPQGMVKDANGNIYVADQGNNVIRKIATDGTVSTFAGNGLSGYVDASATYAEFRGPRGLAIDGSGNIYVADRDNNAIRKITPAGVVSTYAGYSKAGYFNTTQNSSTGVYAFFRKPTALAFDANGNLYVADYGNSAIRKITTGLVVTTVAGAPSQADVVGNPSGIAIDSKGNLYISDETGRVFELTSGNVLYPVAGNENTTGYANGSGTAAQFNAPQGIAVDAAGNVYVADMNNNCIRKLVIPQTN